MECTMDRISKFLMDGWLDQIHAASSTTRLSLVSSRAMTTVHSSSGRSQFGTDAAGRDGEMLA